MASGTAERDAAVEMAERIAGEKRVTVGADKGYDTRGLVREMRERNVTPHVSENTNRKGGSALDRRTTRHAGYRYPSHEYHLARGDRSPILAACRGLKKSDASYGGN